MFFHLVYCIILTNKSVWTQNECVDVEAQDSKKFIIFSDLKNPFLEIRFESILCHSNLNGY